MVHQVVGMYKFLKRLDCNLTHHIYSARGKRQKKLCDDTIMASHEQSDDNIIHEKVDETVRPRH